MVLLFVFQWDSPSEINQFTLVFVANEKWKRPLHFQPHTSSDEDTGHLIQNRDKIWNSEKRWRLLFSRNFKRPLMHWVVRISMCDLKQDMIQLSAKFQEVQVTQRSTFELFPLWCVIIFQVWIWFSILRNLHRIRNSKHPLSPFKVTVENVEPLQNLRLVEIILATSTNIYACCFHLFSKTQIPKFLWW